MIKAEIVEAFLDDPAKTCSAGHRHDNTSKKETFPMHNQPSGYRHREHVDEVLWILHNLMHQRQQFSSTFIDCASEISHSMIYALRHVKRTAG